MSRIYGLSPFYNWLCPSQLFISFPPRELNEIHLTSDIKVEDYKVLMLPWRAAGFGRPGRSFPASLPDRVSYFSIQSNFAPPENWKIGFGRMTG